MFYEANAGWTKKGVEGLESSLSVPFYLLLSICSENAFRSNGILRQFVIDFSSGRGSDHRQGPQSRYARRNYALQGP